MVTISPNYNAITVVIKESDSMGYPKTRLKTYPRPLNYCGKIPVIGVFVSVYRAATGFIDVILSIFKLAKGNDGLKQGWIGTQNIVRAAIEIIPTIALVGIVILPVSNMWGVASVISFFCVPFILIFWDHWNSDPRTESTAPIAAFFDGTCAIELRPTNHLRLKTRQWLDQLYEHGTWVRRDFR